MIILRTIEITNFKGLRKLELQLPAAGAILVSGHNEAGKSTLFEAVYFGLYGSLLVTGGNSGALDDGIAYWADTATVRLVVDAGGTTLDISRTLRRGKSQQARLHVRVPGQEPELVTAIREVGRRIPEELGNLDGDALLNSCFVEQKKLSKLEDLGARDREASMLTLLNLDRMVKLEDQYKVRIGDKDLLALLNGRAEVASLRRQLDDIARTQADLEWQQQAALRSQELIDAGRAEGAVNDANETLEALARDARVLAEELGRLDRAKAALRVTTDAQVLCQRADTAAANAAEQTKKLQALERREREELPGLAEAGKCLTHAAATLKTIESRRVEVRTEQGTIDHAQATLGRLPDLERASEDARTAVETTDKECGDLEQDVRERQRVAAEVVPNLTQRCNSLQALDEQERAVRDQQSHILEAENAVRQARRAVDDLDPLRAGLGQYEQATEDAIAARDQAGDGGAATRRLIDQLHERDALKDWLSGVTLAVSSAQINADLQASRAAEEQAQRGEKAASSALQAARQRLTLLGYGAGLDLLALTVGAVTHLVALLALTIAVLLGLGAAGASALQRFRRTTAAVQSESGHRVEATNRVQQLAAQQEARRQLGSEDRPAAAAARLRALGRSEPRDEADAQARLAELAGAEHEGHDIETLSKRAHSEEVAIADLSTRVERARADERAARDSLAAAEAKQPAQQVVEAERSRDALKDKLQQDIRAVEEGLQALGLPATTTSAQALGAAEQDHKRQTDYAGAVAEVEERLNAACDRRAAQEKRAREAAFELEGVDVPALTKIVVEAQQHIEDLGRQIAGHLSDLKPILAPFDLEPDRLLVVQRAAQVEEQRRQLEASLGEREHLQAEHDKLWQASTELRTTALQSLTDQAAAILEADLGVPEELDESNLRRLRTALEAQIQRLDEAGLGARRQKIDDGRRQARLTMEEEAERAGALRQSATDRERAIAAALGTERATELMDTPPNMDDVQAQIEEANQLQYIAVDREAQTAAKWQLADVALDAEACCIEASACKRDLEVREKACQLLREARTRMVQRVLPNTERNMCLLLPSLTEGRYHDAQITADYQIKVWDADANDYKAKSIFSGGTRDQFSLALRLAFAMAALPQELGTAPGFIFLDEVMGAADDRRAQAIQELLTRGEITTYFRQVLVISHSKDIDTSLFPYHVRLEGGRVVDSNLLPTADQPLAIG